MFGIIYDNKKFILLDSDHDRLRTTALMLAHEETIVVTDYDEEGNKIGQHEETQFVPTYTEETVDEAIKEYAENDIEKAYTGECYLAGFAPQQSVEEKNAQTKETRANLYAELIDPLHAQRQRKTITGEWTESDEAEYVAQVKALTQKIQDENPYVELTVDNGTIYV